MFFSVSLDKSAKVITLLIGLAFGVALFLSVFNPPFLKNEVPYLLTLILGVTFLLCFILSPTGYSILDEELIIHRRFKNVVLRKSEINKAESVDSKRLKWVMRSLGVGGLFGYFGRFWNKEFGSMTWYVTNRNKFVLLEMKNGNRLFLSPDDPELLAGKLK